MFESKGLIIVVAGLLIMGCSQGTNQPAKPVESSHNASAHVAVSKAKTDVVKIVFVGQKEACDCTKDRIDTTWKTLQSALEGASEVVVERIDRDVDTERASRLTEHQALMVAPGIYFFDQNENLLEMLQGEVKSEQITKVL